MAREANQSNKWDFTVKQIAAPHPLGQGRKTGYFFNVREDTGEVLGVTSEQYGLIQNPDLIQTAKAALEKSGLKGYDERILVAGNGQRLYAEFAFKNKQLAIGGKGDLVGYMFRFVNSFDRSRRAALELGFLRLVCLNGMTSMEHELNITRKHSTNVTIDFITDAVQKALEQGPQALKVYQQLGDKSISDEQGVHLLENLEAKGVLSGTLRESITTLWLAPRRSEDKGRNLFNLYNAVTEHLTHKVSGERYEYADKVSGGVLLSLVNAVRKPEVFAKLILPPPSDKVVMAAQGPVIDVEVVQP